MNPQPRHHQQRPPELAGQTVVVIGGSAGIGLETARRARTEGADVVLTGRNTERLQRAGTNSARGAPLPSTPPIRPLSSSSSTTCRGRSIT